MNEHFKKKQVLSNPNPDVRYADCDTFKPYVVEMEGGAVGQVAYLNQVPYLVIRSASDDAGEGAVMKWEEFKELAVKNSSSIIEGVLENMK